MHNILFISRAYGKKAGGMERLSFELIVELEKSASYTVSKIVHETKPGKSLLSTRLQSILFVLTILPKALLASRHADIVHIGDPVLSFIGWSIMRIRKIPVVVTVHGLDVAYANIFYQVYLTLFFRSFSAYIPISEHAKKLLEKHSVSGTVQVIPPGIHDKLYDNTKTKENLRTLLHKDIADKYIIATTGRLVARKGHAWFIKHVMPHLPKHAIYVIAGSGPETGTIAKLIQSLSLEDRVLMLGRISDDDQKTLLNTIDAFVQPNILVAGDAEGFGIAPLEAALCNCAVFAANIDGIPSAIHDGKNGTLLESGNADIWIRELTKPMPMLRAREYTLKTFSWSTISNKYKDILTQTLTSH